MKPQHLPNIERAILSVQDELYSLGLEHLFSLSDIEAMLVMEYSPSDIVTQALLMQ